ncbi:hypothetical protein ACIPY2_18685 [Paenarthrobacter sp. NPDC089675]|uniref:hypothetical protein n=1 Tax=Paenarthrobacter sp. NPDC089675 TaxID=3364376 RepID=UPI0037F876A3
MSTETRVEADANITISRYADGSFQAATVSKATQVVDLGDMSLEAAKARASVSTRGTMMGCTAYNGSGYSVNRNCSISNSWGVTAIAFVANFSILNGTYDTIDGVGATTQNCSGYTCSRPEYVVQKFSEDGYGAAVVSAQSTVSGAGRSYEIWVALNVGGDSAWVSNS